MPLDQLFNIALNFILNPARDGKVDDSAPGETFKTSLGITEMTFQNALDAKVVSGEFPPTPDQAEIIYYEMYWQKNHCDKLPDGIAIMLFNEDTLCGNGAAARLLQRCIGAVDDGIVGHETITKVWEHPLEQLMVDFKEADETYLSELANAPLFLNGWTRREEACWRLAKQVEGF